MSNYIFFDELFHISTINVLNFSETSSTTFFVYMVFEFFGETLVF
jgi:hypothetical protein